MSFDAATFRAALGHFCSGVTVVSASAGEDVRAVTASAFTSVSLDPPMVLVCLQRRARIIEIVRRSGRYAVSILTSEQGKISDRFGRSGEPSAFAFEAWNGLPVIEGALVHVATDVTEILDGGDHHILLGHVRHIRIGSGEPLLYYRGGYHMRSDRSEV